MTSLKKIAWNPLMKSKMSIQLLKMIQMVFLFLVLKIPEMKIRLLKNLNKLMQCLKKRAVKVMEKKSGELGVCKKMRLQRHDPKTRHTCSNIDSRGCHYPFSFGNGP